MSTITSRLQEIFKTNENTLEFINQLNQQKITNAITGSSALYIHGEFGRRPSDLDIYTSIQDLQKISKLYNRNLIVKNFPPVSWTQLEEKENQPHVLVKLECNFPNGAYYDFSLTNYVISNFYRAKIDNTIVSVVPSEEVLLLKLTAPRKSETKDDIKDVESYLKINKLNKEYFINRAEQIGVLDLVKAKNEMLNTFT